MRSEIKIEVPPSRLQKRDNFLTTSDAQRLLKDWNSLTNINSSSFTGVIILLAKQAQIPYTQPHHTGNMDVPDLPVMVRAN